MAKIIYAVLQKDEAMNESEVLCAFSKERDAEEFVQVYIMDNFGTALDMRMGGVDLSIEPTIFQK